MMKLTKPDIVVNILLNFLHPLQLLLSVETMSAYFVSSEYTVQNHTLSGTAKKLC